MTTDAFAWFDEARFGLFIHWGMYAVLERGEQVLFREHLDRAAYERLADRFTARRFDPDAWARTAAEAGMRYAVLTTKHHDGYCLFDSALTDFTAVRTGPRRDLVAEYVAACRRHGLRVGLYYSLGDWRWSAYFAGPEKDPEGFAAFRQYIHWQVRELCTNYGQIDVLWFDGGWPHDAATWQAAEMDRLIRSLQPNVMINDRLHDKGTAPEGLCGYFDTAEQRAPGDGRFVRPVETCRTTHERWWGYCRGDAGWKTPRQVVGLLSDAASRGANLLLNVGPKADGTLPAPFVRTLREVGRWTAANGEAIYGSARGILDVSTLGRTTVKGDAVYVHVSYWPGRRATIYGLANKVLRATILGAADDVLFRQEGLHVRLNGLPVRAPDPLCTVIRLEVEGAPREDPSVIRLWEQGRDLSSLARWSAGDDTAIATDR